MVPDSKNYYLKAPPDKGASSFIYPPTPANLDFFSNALGAGCLVAVPTETVYGLAALALDATACRSIFEVKGRPLVDPLIVHVGNMGMVERLAYIPDELDLLAKAFWPGPLTLILKKKPVVPDLITAGKPTVAIRWPRHKVLHQLLDRLEQPLAAPSANPFGYISPTQPSHVKESFGERVPYIIDGGPCEIGLESTILDLSNPCSPKLLRPGSISAGQIESVLNKPVPICRASLPADQYAVAPGTYSKHYSPQTSLSLFESGSKPSVGKEDAVVFLKRPMTTAEENCYWLSEDGSMEQVGASLFALLRRLDKCNYAQILCEFPDPDSSGISLAIADRLKRAANQ